MPCAADQHVVAGAAGDAVVPGTAHQHVVVVAALEIDSGRSGEHRGVDDVLTGRVATMVRSIGVLSEFRTLTRALRPLTRSSRRIPSP